MEIKVKTQKNYSVVIEENLDSLKGKLKEVISGDKVAIITDDIVAKLYLSAVKNAINTSTYDLVIENGEDSKNLENYVKILEFLAENNFKRKDTIIALGGGVVGDLAGFCASTYMRGINLVMIPTTLLSMVDSSVGGKTAVNLKTGKNLVGAFYQPSLVYINVAFLNTLPKREKLSGIGEVFKYSFIKNGVCFEDVKKGVDSELIYNCIDIKRQVVENDERESGERKLLNLGHTIGHAIEKIENFKLSHGECVLRGIYYSLKISKKLNVLSDENYKKCLNALSEVYDYSGISYDKDSIINYVKTDKKGDKNSVDFVLVNNNLKAEIKNLSIEDIYRFI